MKNRVCLKRKRGRPRLVLNEYGIYKLSSIGCTTPEIAQFCGCSEDTIERNYADILKRGRAMFRIAVRNLQFESAMHGNVTMLIWLGKQYLGQSNHISVKKKGMESKILERSLKKTMKRT